MLVLPNGYSPKRTLGCPWLSPLEARWSSGSSSGTLSVFLPSRYESSQVFDSRRGLRVLWRVIYSYLCLFLTSQTAHYSTKPIAQKLFKVLSLCSGQHNPSVLVATPLRSRFYSMKWNIHYEQSLSPLRDSRGKRVRKRARKSSGGGGGGGGEKGGKRAGEEPKGEGAGPPHWRPPPSV